MLGQILLATIYNNFRSASVSEPEPVEPRHFSEAGTANFLELCPQVYKFLLNVENTQVFIEKIEVKF
jgi:hypothetical protein